MFTDTFGGSTLQPAQVSYRAIALAASIALVWPAQSTASDDFAARLMDVTPSLPALAVNMPPANAVGTGYDVLFNNRGAFTFVVNDAAGTPIATVLSGASVYLYVSDNSTEAGVWKNLGFGTGTSSNDAASLAGFGIAASGAKLQSSRPVSAISGGRTIAPTDRAQVYVWTGGAGTLTLPLVGTVGTDFFFEVRNQGAGVLTLQTTGGELIDASGTITLQPAESCIVHGGTSANWYTVGRGRNQQFGFTLLAKNVTGGSVVLTSTEAANVVQRYSGALTSNCIIVLPSVVQVYYVTNATSGAFSLTFQTAGVGSTVTVPQNQSIILFCDGTNVINSSTTVAGITSATLAQGTVSSPSLNYVGDLTTGMFQPATSQIGWAIAGVQEALLTGTGFNATDIGQTTPGKGAFTTLSATQPLTLGLGAVGAPSYSFTGDSNTGLWSPGADTLAWSTTGAERMRLTSAGGLSLSSPTAGVQLAGTSAISGTQFALVNTNPANASSIIQVANDVGTLAAFSVDGSATAGYGARAPGGSYIYSAAAAGLTVMNDHATGVIKFAAGGNAERMRIDAAGNVGIGAAANASIRLDVTGPAAAPGRAAIRGVLGQGAYLSIAGNGLVPGTSSLDLQQDNAGNVDIVQRSNARMSFYTNSAERIQIGAGGDVGVGGSAINNFSVIRAGAVNADLTTSAAADAYWNFRSSSATKGYVGYGSVSGTMEMGALGVELTLWTAGAERFRVYSSGAKVTGSLTLTGPDLIVNGVGALAVGGSADTHLRGTTILLQNTAGSVTYCTFSAAGIFDVAGRELGYRGLPVNTPADGSSLTVAQRGGMVVGAFSSLVVPSGIFARGDVITIYQDGAAAMTITQGVGMTLRLNGTATTGNRTLAGRGTATILFNGAAEAVVTGAVT